MTLSRQIADKPPPHPVITSRFGLFILGLLICASVAFYFSYTSSINGTPDFFAEWVGVKVAFEGGNPYSAETTRQIQLGSKGHLIDPTEDQLAFVYPYWRVFLSLPQVWLPYSWASATWLGFLLALYVAAIHLTIQAVGWKFNRPLEGALVYLCILLAYQPFSALMLGHMAFLVGAFIGGTYYFLRVGNSFWAGVCLALCTTRPQLAVLLVPFLILYALWRRDWRFMGGFVATLGGLSLISFIAYPDWLNQFLQSLSRYSSYKRSLTAPGLMFEWLGDYSLIPVALTWLLILGIGLLAIWPLFRIAPSPIRGERAGVRGENFLLNIRPKAKALKSYGDTFDYAFSAVLILTLLLPPQTNTGNAAILFIPIIILLHHWQGKMRFYVLAFSVLIVGWILYFLLYNVSQGALLVIPPLIMSGLLIFDYFKFTGSTYYASQEAEQHFSQP